MAKPYLSDSDFTLYNCDVLEGLLARRCVGIELNPKYAELAAKRTAQLSLLGEDAQAREGSVTSV